MNQKVICLVYILILNGCWESHSNSPYDGGSNLDVDIESYDIESYDIQSYDIQNDREPPPACSNAEYVYYFPLAGLWGERGEVYTQPSEYPVKLTLTFESPEVCGCTIFDPYPEVEYIATLSEEWEEFTYLRGFITVREGGWICWASCCTPHECDCMNDSISFELQLPYIENFDPDSNVQFGIYELYYSFPEEYPRVRGILVKPNAEYLPQDWQRLIIESASSERPVYSIEDEVVRIDVITSDYYCCCPLFLGIAYSIWSEPRDNFEILLEGFGADICECDIPCNMLQYRIFTVNIPIWLLARIGIGTYTLYNHDRSISFGRFELIPGGI